MNTINIIELAELAQEADGNIIFIDVRTPFEYEERHISGVKNIPLDVLDDYLHELEDAEVVYVHCKTGGRAEQACEALTALGIVNVIRAEGSIDDLTDEFLIRQ